MDLFYVFCTSMGSIIVLFILTKLMGNRQMSQLSMFDYINGITIGSISAEMATSLENFAKPLLAMVIYAVVAICFSMLTNKSLKARRVLEGEAKILLNQGKINEKNLKKAKLDLSELLVQCRNSGYFDISTIQTAILETNGKISFLPICTERPLTPNDMQIHPKQDKMVTNIILDGNVMEENLKFMGKDTHWLQKQINALGAGEVKEVFLATCDIHDKVTIFKKNESCQELNIFE